MNNQIDTSGEEPEVKYLVGDICEAYQDGVAIWDGRVSCLLIGEGKEVQAAKELRQSLEDGGAMLGRAYSHYYGRAGRHFAIGDAEIQTRLAHTLHILTAGVVDVLEQAHDDAISCIPCLPSSFHQYQPINYDLLRQRSTKVHAGSLSALQDLFNKISDWAVPLHTLPPLASPPTTTSEIDYESESFFERLRSPFHRHRYEYEELPSQYSIRLVKVNAAKPYVLCDIATFHLTDPPLFQALSYCWGKGGQTADIWCNDRLFKVSTNLKKGLQRLHKLSSRVKWFWIDQICINQKNFAERTEQVRLMRAIYQRANSTVIWLGPDDGYAREAFSLVSDLYQRSLRRKSNRSTSADENQYKSRPVDLPQEGDARWASLSRFLELPWFERCWIIQEVVVSQGDPVILCGIYQILWSRFQEAMTWVAHYHSRYRTDRMKLLNAIFDLSSSSDVWELQSLLHSTRAFQATDARDKVFALFGLAGESRSPDSWPKALMPNYNRSTRDVYTEVTLYCITKTGRLSILSQVERSSDAREDSDGKDYPSWVPRWNLPQLSSAFNAYDVTQNGSRWKLLTERFNRSSKSFPISLDSYSPPGVLRLEGVRVSMVESCLPAMFPGQAPVSASTTSLSQVHPGLLQNLPEWFELLQARLSHLTPEEFMRTFFLVTTAGLTPEQTDARQESMAHFRAFLTSTQTKTRKHDIESNSMYSLRTAFKSSLSISTLTPSLTLPTSAGSLRNPPPPSRTLSSPSALPTHVEPSPFSEPPSDPTRYTSALTRLLYRRLFITSSGLLGLGPADMMSGDVVVVLFGGNVPFAIRKIEGGHVGDQWKLIGECYVDGAMGGEMVEGRDEDGEGKRLNTEWFDLI
ncbi:HET-domain-containing protein [Lentithecium fluviatile CBS 122367]|uniref:HET-domain-containing protein n=1 Tax=Lentithecium fluviatile CBS 122367 TaxID=1168545 RepID=A0A6G1J2F3_9PLEO|nr:HET-domain-containing protein [Lentithecium fluviatile CBS 122367]